MSRADRRHCARDARRRARTGSHVDPDFLRRAARAWFLIDEAERHGIAFSIEAGRLAVEFPLSIELRFWRQLQEAILDNKQTIANLARAGRPMILADAIARARQADTLVTAQSLGARLRRINAAEHVGPCPACGGTDRFSVNVRKQAWNCRGGRGGRDAISLVMHVRGCDFREAIEHLTGEDTAPAPARPPAPPKPKPDTSAFVALLVADIIREIVPVRRSPGEQYLAEIRQIDTDAIVDVLGRTDAIGWHPAVLFREEGHAFDGRRLGCIVAIMTDAVTAKPTGAISRTYLGPDGTKISKAKALGAPAGIVRLSADEDVEGGLHLCEGLETGLCAMSLGFRPLWATGSTSLMRVFPVLGGVECLTTLADRDGNGAGEEAATESARRWRAAGREARVKRLNQGLGDINDAVRRSR